MQLTDVVTVGLLATYAAALSIMTAYSVAQGHLSYLYLKSKLIKPDTDARARTRRDDWPTVTVQLPLFNEMYVVERLLDAIITLDYPSDKLEIQILDDSTDETSDIIRQKLKSLTGKGLDIHHIQRSQRDGYKAGALKHGMNTSKGEFIAVFDADFLPPANFLKDAIGYMDDPGIGMVQTRWGHLNENYSFLTRLLAFALDAHFSVEQGGRNFGAHFINFNGTAGVWRTAAIEEAGGWEADTLTEDLDLSYRAQLCGWKFRFAESIVAPAELPVSIAGIKSQQFRWTKGAAESARKNLARVLRSSLPLETKLHATAHLLSCLMCVCLLSASIVSVLISYQLQHTTTFNPALKASAVFIVGFCAIVFVYWTAQSARKPKHTRSSIGSFAFTFLAFTAMYIGLSIHNSIATFEGLTGIKSAFIRTPKFNIRSKADDWTQHVNYTRVTTSPVMILEALAALYFAAGATMEMNAGLYYMAAFHTLAAAGFGGVTYYNFHHR